MFKNRTVDDKNNLCGHKIHQLRKQQVPVMSQRALADALQRQGIDIDKNAVQRIESGQRFVTDIELYALANVFETTADELIKQK